MKKTGEKMYLYTEIGKDLVEIEENLGWIDFKIQEKCASMFRGSKYIKFSLTHADAKELAEALIELTKEIT